jgi:hypothetical protein
METAPFTMRKPQSAAVDGGGGWAQAASPRRRGPALATPARAAGAARSGRARAKATVDSRGGIADRGLRTRRPAPVATRTRRRTRGAGGRIARGCCPPRYPRSPPTPTPGQCRVRGAVRGRDTGAFAPPRAARLLYDMKSHSDIRCHFMGRARVTFPTCRRPPAHSAARGTAGLTCSARHHRSGEAGKLGCSRRGSGAQRQRGR